MDCSIKYDSPCNLFRCHLAASPSFISFKQARFIGKSSANILWASRHEGQCLKPWTPPDPCYLALSSAGRHFHSLQPTVGIECHAPGKPGEGCVEALGFVGHDWGVTAAFWPYDLCLKSICSSLQMKSYSDFSFAPTCLLALHPNGGFRKDIVFEIQSRFQCYTI